MILDSNYVEISEEELVRMANGGNARAAAVLGAKYYYFEDKGKEAVKWLEKAVALGEKKDACYILGLIYTYGTGVKMDDKKATEYYGMAYNAGNEDAMSNYLHNLLSFGRSKENVDTAFKILKSEIKRGNIKAYEIYGTELIYGINTKQNVKKGIKYLLKAMDAGNSDAPYSLASAYRTGVGKLAQNIDAAFHYYNVAVKMGNEFAYKELAEVKKLMGCNDATIVSDLKAGMAKGDEDACFELAVLYLEGKSGVKKDKAKAFSIFMTGAKRGYIDCMTQVGIMYEQGIGVEQNLNKALEWYRKAAKFEDTESMEAIIRFYDHEVPNLDITDEEVASLCEILGQY